MGWVIDSSGVVGDGSAIGNDGAAGGIGTAVTESIGFVDAMHFTPACAASTQRSDPMKSSLFGDPGLMFDI